MSSEIDRPHGLLIVISAPSGAGKTSLLQAALAADSRLAFSVSYTTREPRPGEINGQHYHFVDVPAFQARLAAADFMEHAEVFGNWYGTSRSATQARLTAGYDLILEIDWQGARLVRNDQFDCVSIFILPPSMAELQQRLERRGKDKPEVIAKRMAEARAEMSHWHEYDYVIVNDNFERAVAEINTIITAARLRKDQQLQRLQSLLQDMQLPDNSA